jgi:CHAT domain-containing protein
MGCSVHEFGRGQHCVRPRALLTYTRLCRCARDSEAVGTVKPKIRRNREDSQTLSFLPLQHRQSAETSVNFRSIFLKLFVTESSFGGVQVRRVSVPFLEWVFSSPRNTRCRAIPIPAYGAWLLLHLLGPACLNGQPAAALLVQADRLADQGDWSKARPLYASAETDFQRLGDLRNELYAKLGRLHGDVQAGSYSTTRAEAVQILAEQVVQNDPELKIRAWALLGNIDLNLNTAAAEADWRTVLDTATAAGDKKWQNRARGELGLVAGVNGNLGAAALALFQAITEAAALGDVSSQVNFATWLANGMSVNGMADRALQLIDQASDLARKNGYSEMPLQLTIAKIRALLLLPDAQKEGRRRDARALITATLEDVRKNGVLGAQTELLIQAAQMAIDDRNYGAAEQNLFETVEIAKRADLPREAAEALLQLSRVYRAINQPAMAAPVIDQGIATLQRVEEAYDLPLFLAEKAQVQAALGTLGAADSLYGQATDLVEGLLVNAQSSRVKTSMIGALGEIYIGHFRLAWERLHNPERAFQIIEGARGRALLDSIRYSQETNAAPTQTSAEKEIARLQRSLLHDRLNASQTRGVLAQLDYAYFRLSPIEYTRSRKEVEILRKPPVGLATLRRQLAPQESLVEFIIDANTSYAVCVTQAGLTIRTLPGRNEISQMVVRFLTAVKNKADSGPAGQELFRRVLKPILDARASGLIVVPDGPLHLVPFGALKDDDGITLNRRLTVVAVPSATIYFTLKTEPEVATARRPFLGLAYTQARPATVQMGSNTRGVFDLIGADLKPLQFAREEIVEAANALGPGSVTLEGDKASEAALKAQPLGDFKVIHIAAHGVSSDAEPDRAALVLAAGADSEDGLWQAREIRRSRLNAEVVVLSACETGTGRLAGEEGIMSLARAFLAAGAKSVVASLWAVEDRATATLMENFYRHLAGGLQVRDALRQAQLDFIRDYGDRAQPYYWAGFEVIGDGTRRINFKTDKPDKRGTRADFR